MNMVTNEYLIPTDSNCYGKKPGTKGNIDARPKLVSIYILRQIILY